MNEENSWWCNNLVNFIWMRKERKEEKKTQQPQQQQTNKQITRSTMKCYLGCELIEKF